MLCVISIVLVFEKVLKVKTFFDFFLKALFFLKKIFNKENYAIFAEKKIHANL